MFTLKAALRYFSSFGLRPVLALKTREGAFLSVEDKISDVLSTNEEVLASVESWDLPALSERYRDACIHTNTSKWLSVGHFQMKHDYFEATMMSFGYYLSVMHMIGIY